MVINCRRQTRLVTYGFSVIKDFRLLIDTKYNVNYLYRMFSVTLWTMWVEETARLFCNFKFVRSKCTRSRFMCLYVVRIIPTKSLGRMRSSSLQKLVECSYRIARLCPESSVIASYSLLLEYEIPLRCLQEGLP